MQGQVWGEPELTHVCIWYDFDTRCVCLHVLGEHNLVEDGSDLETLQVQPLVLCVFAPLSLWLALSTISLTSRFSAASLELQLA